jgi:hypothetical protein
MHGETNIKFRQEYLEGKDHLVDLVADCKVVLNGIFTKENIWLRIGLVWVKIGNFWAGERRSFIK